MAEQLCPCGNMQTELHVLESCPITQDIRTTHNFTFWSQLIDNEAQFCNEEIVYIVLSCFDYVDMSMIY